MSRDLRIGCLECAGDDFISSVVINRTFAELIGRFAEVQTLATTPAAIGPADLEALRADYLLVDLHNFGFIPFVLRERHAIDVRFVAVLHSVHAWAGLLLYTLPFVKPGDLLLAPSASARRSLLRLCPAADVQVVPYCVDVEAIQQAAASTGDAGRPTDFAYMGRLVPPKGLEALLDGMPAILQAVPDARLNILGPLSGGAMADQPRSPFVASLQRRVEAEGLAGHVEFHGARFGADKYRRLASNGLFVYPTTYAGETGVFSMVEAMACGLPAVATRHAGIEELVTDGENGRLVDVRSTGDGGLTVDPGELAAAVTGLLCDRALLMRMRARARQRAILRDFRIVLPPVVALLGRRREHPLRFDWARIGCRAGPGRQSPSEVYDELMARLRGSEPPPTTWPSHA